MSNRAGLRSPASAASRMRVASDDLLDCACGSGDNELHAKSRATCMFLTVSGLKSLTSATMNVPKETHGVANLARNALARLSDARPTGRAFCTTGKRPMADEMWNNILRAKSGHQCVPQTLFPDSTTKSA